MLHRWREIISLEIRCSIRRRVSTIIVNQRLDPRDRYIRR